MAAAEHGGVIGRWRSESTEWWPEPTRPPAGAPNVVIVVLDDVGYGQFGCFGSGLETPTLDRLARGGLRYANFHTTALCSPTRSCVLTGRNHHANAMGRITDLPTGFPGYTTRIPKSSGFLPEMLVPHGYAAYAVGKWHLTPEDEEHLGASRARWPLGRGFERYYGYFGGETHQLAPSLFYDNHRVTAPRSWEDGYHLSADLADRAIEFLGDLRAVEADKPFFLYFATGACHSPHQAPPEWIERFRGRFDGGWNAWRDATYARQVELGLLPPGTELPAWPEWVPRWDDLDADGRRVAARYMECFAAFLAYTDDQLGRLVDFLEETGELDDTLVFVLSDNGASSEGGPQGSLNDLRTWNLAGTTPEEARRRIDEIGGPTTHNNYPWGWTVAGNTPFRRWKREVHEGGVADPLIVHWPAAIPEAERGAVRHQYAHAIDLVPTVLELVGLEAPATIDGVTQRPLDGVSFAPTLADPAAPSRHVTQYYEMFGCRALYHDGWKAVTFHEIFDQSVPFDADRWELYRVAEDFSECHDLADREPERLREMIDRWWVEAARNDVLPLDNSPFDAIFSPPADSRTRFVYRPGGGPVPEGSAVNVRNRSHSIAAEVEIPEGGASGIVLALGSVLGGFALYLLDGRLVYVHNLAGLEEHRLEAPDPVPTGRHSVGFRFAKTGEHRGDASLLVDGTTVAAGEIRRFTPTRFSLTGESLCCGYDTGMPVSLDYRPPFRFTGALGPVVVEVDGPEHRDPDRERGATLAAD